MGIKNIIYSLIKKIPSKNIIMFESAPDFSDSPMAVFEEMQKRGLADKYKFVWWVTDKNKEFKKYPNTVCVDRKSRLNLLEFQKYMFRAKCLISCNAFLTTATNYQKSFYITHGTVIKNTGDGYVIPDKIDYTLIASDSIKDIMSADMKVPVNKLYGLGYPRNDAMQNTKLDVKELFGNKYDKIMVWYPSFRQHKNGAKTESKNALPILSDALTAEKLNGIAKENNTLIVVKPHFAQDLSYIKNIELTNIKFIDDDFFLKNNISSYQFVGACDALITDYSSIYYDFLLTDKPVAAVWEDIEDYRKNPGFSVDINYYMKGAFKIYTLQDFEEFITDTAKNIDKLQNERAEINKLVNYSDDGKNAERVTDFIIKEAGL